MADESSDEGGKISSDRKYFDYFKRPKEISLNDYVNVYKKFCEAYKIEVTEQDIRLFSTSLYNHILNRKEHMLEGVNYKPMAGRARLFITPYRGYVRFHSFSYDDSGLLGGGNPKFMKLADDYLKNLRKKKSLEDKLK